jgi:hypothetical protein
MERKKRKDCFFGVHFDFHAADDCINIGENTTPELIQHMLEVIKPDFVQCDCKGHPGLTSYPTEVGTAAPGFVRDNLRIWRDVTAAAGIPLFVHYSGVYDKAAVIQNPNWAIVDETGATSREFTSLKGGYSEGLLIPQLCELAEKYDIDGAWVDGEAWAVKKDYSDLFLAAFRRDTGIETVPYSKEDPGHEEYMNYLRKSFLEYLRHYTTEVHQKHPGFEIASNWAFSTYIPEKVSADVDFLSADYNPIDSYNTARFESRYLATQGLPWDLMGWSFVVTPEEYIPSTKTACQIAREASVPLSLGGGFQVYIQQKRDGSVEKWMLPIVGEVSEFCNERKEYCFRAENVPQVAVLLSTYHFYKTATRPLHPDQEFLAIRGITQALLDSQLSVQLISEHHLEVDLMKYPVLVLPETAYLAPEMVEMLHEYMQRGGHLIAAGPLVAQYFAQVAGASMEKPFSPEEYRALAGCHTVKEQDPVVAELGRKTKHYLDSENWLTGVEGLCAEVRADENTDVLAWLYEGNSRSGPTWPAVTQKKVGNGSCTCVWVNTGEKYLMAQRCVIRDLWGKMVKSVFTPMVRVSGTHHVDVNISRKENDLLVHLINTSGSHGSEHTYIYDEITPLHDITLWIDCPVKPKAVEAVPGTPMQWHWEGGKVHVKLEKLDIYTIIALQVDALP